MDKAKLFSLAEKAMAKNQPDKALDALEQILSHDTNDVKALNKAADLHLKLGNAPMAVELLSRVGESYSRDGFYSKAIAIYKRILKIAEFSPRDELIAIHDHLATLYGQLGLVSDAMAHFKIVVDYYDQNNDRESLLATLRKVSDLDPSNLESQLRLAELFAAEDRKDEAEYTLQRLVELLQEKNKTADIAEVYEKWVSLFPKEVDPLRQLIRLFINGGEPKKALGKLQKAFRADPYNPETLELLSATFREMKQPEKAKAVDVELIKIYRKHGNVDRLEVVENRVSDKPPPEALPKESDPLGTRKKDVIDPAEALIQELNLDANERKVISECEVYSKYGLIEKAKEVLKGSLTKFPKSLAIRWKLKNVQQELNESQGVTHSLSEILMLAKESNLSDWVALAAEDLRAVDPKHPSLDEIRVDLNGAEAEIEIEEIEIDTSALEDEAAVIELENPDETSFGDNFEESDISIVVEDDFVSDLQDQESLKAAGEENSDRFSETRRQASLSDEEIEPSASEEGGAEMLLTDDDFSEEELAQLQSQLDPRAESKLGSDLESEALIELSTEDEATIELPVDDNSDAVEFDAIELDISDESLEPEIHVKSDTGDSVEVAQDEDFEVQQALEEVAFFRSQGLAKEADKVFERLKKKYPHRQNWQIPQMESPQEEEIAQMSEAERIAAAEVELEALGTKMKLRVQEDLGSDDEDYFDLAAELAMDELSEGEEAPSDVPSEVKDVFEAFKQGVSQSISAQDYQTHHDLGVAYREMGLIDDALKEFELCSQVDGHRAGALYQMGLCEVFRENYEAASQYFDQALEDSSLLHQEKLSISYELAESLLKLENKDRAVQLFQQVSELDPEFRDVNERLNELRQQA